VTSCSPTRRRSREAGLQDVRSLPNRSLSLLEISLHWAALEDCLEGRAILGRRPAPSVNPRRRAIRVSERFLHLGKFCPDDRARLPSPTTMKSIPAELTPAETPCHVPRQ